MGMEQWKDFFKTKKSVLLLFVFTIVSSTLYVVYLKHMGQLSREILEQYVMRKEMPFEIKHFLGVFIGYLKKCLLVWFLGGFTFLIPLSFLVAFVYIFSYGFSIAVLYIYFGLQGMWMSVLTFGLQGILMVSYLLCLENRILKKVQIFTDITQKSYMLFGLMGIGVAFLMTLVEGLIMRFL